MLVLALVPTACIDRGPPSAEDQMRDLGLPFDNLLELDEEVHVTVRLNEGVPELLIFQADSFGGDRLGINPATEQTVNGGMVGDANSRGPRLDGIDGKHGLLRRYLFGAGQGPISSVEVDEPEAQVELVNPEVDGWVIIVPETVGVATLPWRLIGDDGTVIFESVGTGMPGSAFGIEVEARSRASIRLRDGVPDLIIFTPNRFGGAEMEVFPADRPTVDGGFAGTAVHGGNRYVFGAGQGQLMHRTGAKVLQPQPSDTGVAEVHAYTFNYADDAGWIIVAPETMSINEIQWRLVDPDGNTIHEATGLGPS